MAICWGTFSIRSKKALRIGWLITGGLFAFYIGFVQPRERYRSIASERSAGLAATAGVWTPVSLWRQSLIIPRMAQEKLVDQDQDVVGDLLNADRVRSAAMATYIDANRSSGGGGGEEVSSDRKLVRTANLGLIVRSPAQCSEKIIQLAQAVGGFLVSSQVSGNTDFPSASLAIRVPAARFEQVRSQIRALALRFDSESVDAQDVTKQYVDEAARLRNLRAEEHQYLSILRKAATVKDTLEVSDKLNEVRGAIEERQAEFEALSKQIETVAININLRAETDAQVFGLRWRPLYQLKVSVREGLAGIGDYVSSMVAFVFYLPTILLWMFTIIAFAAIGWRILRLAVRVFFRSGKELAPGSVTAQ